MEEEEEEEEGETHLESSSGLVGEALASGV